MRSSNAWPQPLYDRRISSRWLVALFFGCAIVANVALGIAQVADNSQSEILDKDRSLRLNQVQSIGTHNSYHLAPAAVIRSLIETTSKPVAQSIDYSHAPFRDQLTSQRVRHFELDVYADPKGGLFATPIVGKLLGGRPVDQRMQFDFESIMKEPGFKVLHSPGFDYATTVPTLRHALQELIQWSSDTPNHFPLFIQIEVKEDAPGPAGVTPIVFDANLLDQIDEEVRSIIPRDKLFVPDDLRGSNETLQQAVITNGWPTLGEMAGKFYFALDNTNAVRDRYYADHPSLKGRVLFASFEPDHPAAAWIKMNDPINDFDQIQHYVRQGYMIRTRADADTKESRTNDTKRRDRAITSGAQLISTDYPVPDVRWSPYRVQLENGSIYQQNAIQN